MQKQKLSAWLDENLDSHEIVVSEVFRKHLLEATGCDAPWDSYTCAEMLERRASLNPADERLAGG